MGNVNEKLSAAVTAGDAEGVRQAVAGGADVHHEFLLLSKAVGLGNPNVVEALVASKAFLKDELSAALQEVRLREGEDDEAAACSIVKTLVENGADVDAPSCTYGHWIDITPLLRALGERNDAKAKLLLKCGANPLLATNAGRVNFRDGVNWNTAREEFVREIVHKSVSPITFAFERFDVDLIPSAELVGVLLSFNPPAHSILEAVELACTERATVPADVAQVLLSTVQPTLHHLLLAVEHGQTWLVAAMMDRKCVDPNAHREGLRKEVPLTCAMRSSSHRLEICRTLLRSGANPDVFVSEAWTAEGEPIGAHATPVLYVAAADGDFELVAELVDAGANVGALPPCREEGNILHHIMNFARRFSEPLVALLLRHGADATLADGDGFTPLCVLLQRCEKEQREAIGPDGSKTAVGQIAWGLFTAAGDETLDRNSLQLIQSLNGSLGWAEMFCLA